MSSPRVSIGDLRLIMSNKEKATLISTSEEDSRLHSSGMTLYLINDNKAEISDPAGRHRQRRHRKQKSAFCLSRYKAASERRTKKVFFFMLCRPAGPVGLFLPRRKGYQNLFPLAFFLFHFFPQGQCFFGRSGSFIAKDMRVAAVQFIV